MEAGLVVVGVAEGAGVVVDPDEACDPGLVRAFLMRRGGFRAAFALPAPVEYALRLIVGSLVTLVSKATTPDEYEPEASFDRTGVREMDACAVGNDANGILSGLGTDPAGAASGGAGLGETTRGAATAQIANASVVSAIMPARTTNNDRSPRTGLTNLILIRERIRHYPSFGGGRPF